MGIRFENEGAEEELGGEDESNDGDNDGWEISIPCAGFTSIGFDSICTIFGSRSFGIKFTVTKC